MTRYDWSNAPSKAMFGATDKNGAQFWYEMKPTKLDRFWFPNLGETKAMDCAPDWEESLEARPTLCSQWESEQRVNIGAKP